MKVRAVLSEAIRNVISGTSGGALFALVLAGAFVLFAGGEARTIVQLAIDAGEFRSAGASIKLITAVDEIDGQRCERLGEITGVRDAGALRSTEPTTLLALPANSVTTFEATPGLLGLLNGGPPSPVAGVWLSSSLAEVLGAQVGHELATSGGTVTVAGVFKYPSDGRDQRIAYAVLVPVPAAERFDQCWGEIWPLDAGAEAFLQLTHQRKPATELTEPIVSQLNPSLGPEFNGEIRLESRVSQWAPQLLAVIAFTLGCISVRIRRLELAAALHARMPKSALLQQLIIETALWATAAVILCAPILLWAVSASNPDPVGVAFWAAVRVILAGLGALALGVTAATLSVSERHLFRYFKER